MLVMKYNVCNWNMSQEDCSKLPLNTTCTCKTISFIVTITTTNDERMKSFGAMDTPAHPHLNEQFNLNFTLTSWD